MVSADEFVNGATIEWRNLTRTLYGSLFLAWISGIIGFITGWTDYVATLTGAFTDWSTAALAELWGTIPETIETATSDTVRALEGAGLAGYALGIAGALLVLYVTVLAIQEVTDG